MPGRRSALIVLGALCAISIPAFAQSDGTVCPDLGGHQQVLDQGQRAVYGHGSGFDGGFSGADNPELWTNFNPKDYPRLPGCYTQWIPHADNVPMDDAPFAILNAGQISTIALKTSSEIYAAECYARVYESTGDFYSALKLYRRILGVRASKFSADTGSILAVETAIARVDMFLKGAEADRKAKYAVADAIYTRIVDFVSSDNDLDLRSKYKILNRVITILNHDSTKDLEADKLSKRALQLCSEYNRALQCLNMAESLNSTAFTLEIQGSYELSETLFREALAIKQKNLGISHPETLAQYGDIARLYRDQGRLAESQRLYEQSLASYRKLANPGTTYATMLENYLDLLTGMKQARRADQIGQEVTAYYKRTDVSSRN